MPLKPLFRKGQQETRSDIPCNFIAKVQSHMHIILYNTKFEKQLYFKEKKICIKGVHFPVGKV
jgi:hypothetical protein